MKNYVLERRLIKEPSLARKGGQPINLRIVAQCFYALMGIPVAIVVSCMALFKLKLFRLFTLTR